MTGSNHTEATTTESATGDEVPDQPTADSAAEDAKSVVSVTREELAELSSQSDEKPTVSDERTLGTTRGQRTFLRIVIAVTVCVLGWQWFRAVNDRPDGVTIDRGVYFRIDINTDDWRELDVLDGIGETLAKRIVEYRRTNGRFEKLNDLERVPGVGPITVERLKPWIKVTRPNESASRPQTPQQ